MMTRLLPFKSLRKAGFSRANTLPIEDWPWQGYKWEVCPTSLLLSLMLLLSASISTLSFSVYIYIYLQIGFLVSLTPYVLTKLFSKKTRRNSKELQFDA